MKTKLDISLLESGDVFKKGCAFIANNAGRVIATLTFLIAALVIFTDVSFQDLRSESFCSLMVIIIIASYIIYFSLEDAGEQLGEESEEYVAAREKYLSLASRVGGERLEELRVFCREYSEGELEYRKDQLLLTLGYSRSEYEKYKSGEACDKKALSAFRRADRLKAVALSPISLLSKDRPTKKSELKNPESTKLLYMLLRLLPSTLCMTVTVSVVLSAKESLGVIEVIDGLLKLSSLPIVGFKGYSHGYNFVRRSVSAWLDTKSALIEAFLSKEKIDFAA